MQGSVLDIGGLEESDYQGCNFIPHLDNGSTEHAFSGLGGDYLENLVPEHLELDLVEVGTVIELGRERRDALVVTGPFEDADEMRTEDGRNAAVRGPRSLISSVTVSICLLAG